MINKQEASDLIYAGVLGCLDRADQTKLNEYIRSGGELLTNLGELQNIAALLPIILQAENPDPQLKDKVARKLYRIKDEIRAKVADEGASAAEVFYSNSRENRKSSSIMQNKISPSAETEKLKVDERFPKPEVLNEKPLTNETTKEVLKEEAGTENESKEIKSEDFEPVTPSRNTFESFKSTRERVLEGNFDEAEEEVQEVEDKEEVKPEIKVPTKEKIRTYERVITKEKPSYRTPTPETPYSRTSTKERGKSFEKAYKKRYVTEETPGKKGGINLWVAVTLFIILIMALVVLYLNFSSELEDLKFTNNALKQQVNDLSVKVSSTQDIQNVLESADVKVINLSGTAINPDGRGKLIISGSQNKGYLQLTDMPMLGRNSSYQLWMQLPNGKYYSLGVFNPTERVQYFPFKIPQTEGNNINEYLVTEESSTGSMDPGNKVFLTGTY